ncbi:hypothetical protein HY745_04465 [Candidatus Desantisbacteria bacterium]|nr:hypothetical protein [Candidatus Desantisbacteria bacterium]
MLQKILQMQSLISNFKYGSILTDINTTPQDLLNFSRVLVCPTGSLVGNDSSPQFKALLEQYVSAGGFLVVMSTQHSSDLQCIPVPEGEVLSGYMWREDMSCWSNSCEIQDWHNILSGQSQATISEPVDGFFTEWPGNAKVLLRRSKNGQPCMILYPYGKGYVLATTIYTDYATSVGQASQSGKNLIRDIIAFSKYPVEMSEYRPGASISLPITITNKTDKESVSASVSVLTPDGEIKEVRRQNSEGRIEPWKSITTNYTGTAGNELGIWRIIYALLDSSGIEIQKESSAGNFVVSDPPAVIQPSPDLSFSVQSDAENYAIGSNPVFTVITWNRSNEERNITCKYFFPHHFWTTRDYQYGGDWWKPELQLTKTMIIPPNSSTSFMHTLNNVSTLDRLWAYFYDENGNKVGEASRAINVYQPNIQAGVNTDKSFYGVNETVNVNITLNNMQNISFPSTTILKVLDPKNAKIYEKSFACNFISNAVLNLNDTYTLPAVSEFGYYIAIVEVNDTEGKIIGNASIYFEHLRCQTKTTPNLPSSFIFGTNNISFNLSNTGKVNTSNGNLSVSLKDPDGSEIFLENKSFSLITGGNMALDFDVPIPLFKSGNYILSYIQSDETNTGEIYKIQIPSSIATNLSFDKPFYKIRDTANLSLSLKNIGKFNMGNVEVKLQVPDAGYIDTKDITLSADTEIILNYTSVIPETMLNGNHNIEVQLTSSGNTLTQNFIFTIPESNINIVGLANTTYSSGNNIGLNIENTGGVDTDVNYIIELYDLRNFKFANVTGTTAVKSDSTILLELPIPNSARTGKYYVHASCLDVKTNKSSYFIKETEVIGNSISLAVETDKDIYFSNESINATTSFTANSGQILNGNLNVKVLATVPEQIIKKYTWWNPDWYYRIPIKIESGNYERKDSPIEMNISFTEILNNIGKTGTFDENSIRIIEYDSIGNIIKEIPYQFNKVTDYNAVINAGIEAVWIMDGITPIGVTRHYVLYFDILENGAKEIPDYGVISAVLDNTNKYFKTSGVRIKWGGNGCLGYGADIITDFRFDDNNNNNPDDDLDRIQNEEWNHVYYFSLVMLKLEIEMKNL